MLLSYWNLLVQEVYCLLVCPYHIISIRHTRYDQIRCCHKCISNLPLSALTYEAPISSCALQCKIALEQTEDHSGHANIYLAYHHHSHLLNWTDTSHDFQIADNTLLLIHHSLHCWRICHLILNHLSFSLFLFFFCFSNPVFCFLPLFTFIDTITNLQYKTHNFTELLNFTDKTLKDERITLVDRDKIITEEKDVVKKFKDHFEKSVETLKIDHPILTNLNDDPVLNDIENFLPPS